MLLTIWLWCRACWIIQNAFLNDPKSQKGGFWLFFEFGLLNEVGIAYCDTLERSLRSGRSVRSARSVWLLTDVEDALQRATVLNFS